MVFLGEESDQLSQNNVHATFVTKHNLKIQEENIPIVETAAIWSSEFLEQGHSAQISENMNTDSIKLSGRYQRLNKKCLSRDFKTANVS